jgi:hypothetical protein
MAKITAHLTILLLVFWVTGGQWLMLQSVAWVNMIHDFSKTDSLSQSLCKTFDGHHACPLCRFIQKEKSTQTTDKSIPNPPKNLFLLVPFAVLLILFLNQPLFNFAQRLLPEPYLLIISPPPETFTCF